MNQVVLIVEKDDQRRATLRQAFVAEQVPVFEVADAFDAMSALGRAQFGAVLASAGKRQLSLRGLCQLARRRHADIQLFISIEPADDPQKVRQAIGVGIEVVSSRMSASAIAMEIKASLLHAGATDVVPHTQPANARSAAPPPSLSERPEAGFGPVVEALEPDEPTATGFPAVVAPKPASRPPSIIVADMSAEEATLVNVDAPSVPDSDEPTAVNVLLEPRSDSEEPTRPNAAQPLFADPSTDDGSTEDTIRMSAAPAGMRDASAALGTVQSGPGAVKMKPLPSGRPSEAPIVSRISEPVVAEASVPPDVDAFSDEASETLRMDAPAPIDLGVPSSAPERAPVGFERGGGTMVDVSEDSFALPPLTGPGVMELDQTAPDVRHPFYRAGSTSEPPPVEPLFEGTLDGAAGPALLMSFHVQDFTGRLVIDSGPAIGTLYFFQGEPVWAAHPAGDAGMLLYLQEKGRAPRDLTLAGIVDGELLSNLASRGLLGGQSVHDALRDYVRARVLDLATQNMGSYRFFEDRTFLDTLPLLKVNSFGLLLEARRRRMSPDEILSVSNLTEWKYVYPGPALAPVSPKLKAFTRGTELAHHVTGQRRVRQVLGELGLDPLMGTLVMLTLEDARLVTLHEEPQQPFTNVELSETTTVQHDAEPTDRFLLPDSEIDDSDGAPSSEEATAREEIFSLYMQLKPLTGPAEVLGLEGVPLNHDKVRQAYERRMAQLDPRHIPEGSARQLLVARVEELRAKVTRAFESLSLHSK